MYLPDDVFASKSGRVVREEFYTTDRPAKELYDLQTDPQERRNLVDDPAYAEELERFREHVRHRMIQDNDPLCQRVVYPPDGETSYTCPICQK